MPAGSMRCSKKPAFLPFEEKVPKADEVKFRILEFSYLPDFFVILHNPISFPRP